MLGQNNRKTRRLAGPILFLLIFIASVAVPTLAAENFWPPYDPQGRYNDTLVQNGTLDTTPCCFEKYKYCLDENTQATDGSTEVDQILGDGTYSITNFTSHTKIVCLNGCSYTLGTCRPDAFTEAGAFVAMLAVLGIVCWLSPRFGTLGIIVGAAAFILSLYVAFWDVFTEPIAFMTKLLPIAVIVSFVYQWAESHGENEDD